MNAYLDEVIYRPPGAIVRYFEEKTRQYDRVVVPSQLNLRFDVLDQLDKSKLEFLVNSSCFWCCPFSTKHYTAISRGFKSAGGSSGQRVCLARIARGAEQDRVLEHLRKHHGIHDGSGNIKKLKHGQPVVVRKSWMKFEDIALMQRKGCVHFKLQGRDMAADLYRSAMRQWVVEYVD